MLRATFIGDEFTIDLHPSKPIDWAKSQTYAVIETLHRDLVRIRVSNKVATGEKALKLDKRTLEDGNKLLWIEVNYPAVD